VDWTLPTCDGKIRAGLPDHADNDSPVLRDYAAASRVLLVLFSGLRRNPGERAEFSFGNAVREIPVKKLFVRDFAKAWYLRGMPPLTRGVAETSAFFRNEISESGAERVVMIGYSLGGFAALLYGALVDADETHSFSPQTFVSLRRRVLHRDHRWNRYVLKLPLVTRARYRDVRPVLRKAGGRTTHHVYFAEDNALDALHARRLANVPGVALHPHPRGKHRLVMLLRDTGELAAILDRAVNGPSS